MFDKTEKSPKLLIITLTPGKAAFSLIFVILGLMYDLYDFLASEAY
jgi:hypothetical protein